MLITNVDIKSNTEYIKINIPIILVKRIAPLNGLNIKNLILYHTEDTHPNDKDILYKKEAKQYFDNNIIVPKDLDIIEIK